MNRLLPLLLLALAPVLPAQDSGEPPSGVELARDRVYPALVNIRVVSRDHRGGRALRQGSVGSGTVISPEGHVLTNYHVVQGAVRVTCTLVTGESMPATVVGHDPETDLSLLLLDRSRRHDPEAPIAWARISERERVEVGEQVLAVGNPLSLSSSLTLGVVSNPGRVFLDPRGTGLEDLDVQDGSKTGIFTLWIQHDALILPGNSGGPLVDMKGEIVGVNTRGGNGYGFASPARLVRKVVAQLKENGEVRRGFLGASWQPVAKLGLEAGALIGAVLPSSPAAAAGLLPGDVVLALDGEPVDCRFFEQVPLLYGRIAERAPGSDVAISYRRGDEVALARARLAPRDRFVGREVSLRRFGVSVREITGPMATARGWEDDRGVLVTGVRPGFPFEEAKPPIRPGAVLRRLGDRDIVDLEGFLNAVEELADEEEIAVLFRGGREEILTVLDLGRSEERRGGGELPRPWIGIRTQVLTPEIAEALSWAQERGFRVTEVFPWTRAAEAGLRVGDLIVSVDGEPLESHRPQDARDLENLIQDRHDIGDELELGLRRPEGEATVTVELEETPASAAEARTARADDFEFGVRELTFMDRVSRELERDGPGLICTEATAGGWVESAGVAAGDLLLRLGEHELRGIDDFERALEGLREKRPSVVPVFLRRGRRTLYAFVEPDWNGPVGGAGEHQEGQDR